MKRAGGRTGNAEIFCKLYYVQTPQNSISENLIMRRE